MANNRILLLEPGYKNKYPPLGLMKIAQYHGANGKGDYVRFVKGEDRSVLEEHWDRIYVTTLFSFEYARIAESIDFAISAARGFRNNVFVGGIAASLMHERFLQEPRWRGVRVISGLLNKAPAVSLQLDSFSEELYSDDVHGRPIEDLIPDYSILAHTSYKYPVHDAYFAYASRGCIRKCSFCGVPKLEGDLYETPSLSAVVKGVAELYGEKKDLLLMDNNVVASPRFNEIIAEIRDLGFGLGARLNRGRGGVQRRVDFNQGVDARILCKDSRYLKELSTICLSPLRIAFDHLGVKRQYEQAIRYAHQYGMHELSNYMLYNFHDSPADLFERMRLNVSLNEELGIRIFSFPMRFQPTDLPDRSYVGKKWNKYYLRSMQIILQATQGIVSGSPDFFKRAFGDTCDEFEEILLRPHHMIFNRSWYEEYGGRGEFETYLVKLKRLTPDEKAELMTILCGVEPRNYSQAFSLADHKIAEIGMHYIPIPRTFEREIWQATKERRAQDLFIVPEDERVEDAGLDSVPEEALV